eukprot:6194327-Pleurochrysis_carterae.AAC.1
MRLAQAKIAKLQAHLAHKANTCQKFGRMNITATNRTRSSTRLTKEGERTAGNDMMEPTMTSLSAEDVQR